MEISGKILDSTNQPLYLANITIVTGSQINKFGTVANENGEFSLSNDIISADSQFKISYQGFKPQYYRASELQGKTIKLEDDTIGLDEVIVRPKDKPKNTSVASQPSNIKQHFQKHKLVYAGLGAIIGLSLLAISIKKLK
jgi:acid stress-induced BolA-like protein IbaG/YrbA